MPEFVTYAELKNFSFEPEAINLEKAMKMRSFSNTTIFLSHSSKDHELLPGVALILENHGGRVYVDEKDPQLVSSNITEIAERLRKVVKNCLKFVLFVTENSKDSKWIPWELGLGDGDLKEYNVALFPAAEKASEITWAEVEYLGLYKRIVWGELEGYEKPMWMVYDYHTNIGIPLRKWLTNG